MKSTFLVVYGVNDTPTTGFIDTAHHRSAVSLTRPTSGQRFH
jgi:hypothetical protein